MRARNIKPGFCSNKRLLRCSIESTALFAMLWMMADREGRLSDDPEQIELDSFYRVRGIDCNACLSELAQNKLIARYTVDGENCIQIVGFLEHQKPHPNERDSVIPEQLAPLHDNSCNYISNPAESLNPSSLNPSSLNLESKTPPTPSRGPVESGGGYTQEFLEFWKEYPKKKSKGQAFKAWKKQKRLKDFPGLKAILEAIAANKAGHDWQRDGGQFIQHPATWLNARGWEDEVSEPRESPADAKSQAYKQWGIAMSLVSRGETGVRLADHLDTAGQDALMKIGGLQVVGTTSNFDQPQLKARFVDLYLGAR